MPGGAAVPVTINTPGQNARLTFNGTAGQKVSLVMSGVTITGSYVYIKKPDGTDLASVYTRVNDGLFIDGQTLPVTGTYSIFIDPASSYTGNLTFTLYDASEVISPISPNGTPVTITTVPGQNAKLNFNGPAGQQVSLDLTNVTNNSSTVSIINPDGTTLTSRYVVYTGAFIDGEVLPATGTYTITVDPESKNSGSITLTLYDNPEVVGTISIGGAAVDVTISALGQNAKLTLAGTAGQPATVHITNSTISVSTVQLVSADGTVLTSTTAGTGSFDLATQTLPATGTYTIRINPEGRYTGSLRVSVTNP